MDEFAVVETDDGTIALTDTDADGQADLMTQLDADGDVVGRARFDLATGDWVHIDDTSDPVLSGDVEVAAPTDDSDGDGRLDTVVVTDARGDTLIFTDADEDGDADYATEITGDGHITVSEHTDDGDWTVIERGHLDEHGAYHQDIEDTEDTEGTEASGWITDPRTGHWRRDPVE